VTLVNLFIAKTGMASPQIRKVLNDAIESVIAAHTPVKIAFIRVDGDEGYGANLTVYFSKIKSYLGQCKSAEGKSIEEAITLCSLRMGDWVHFLENARTRLVTR
jgi:hypothetical protein